jgi:hypothetical protein
MGYNLNFYICARLLVVHVNETIWWSCIVERFEKITLVSSDNKKLGHAGLNYERKMDSKMMLLFIR